MPTLPSDAPAVPHISLPAWPIDLVRTLAERPIWLAGGPVRDLLIHRNPQDWDFVCDGGALPLARALANAMGGAFFPLDTGRGTGRAIVRNPAAGGLITLDFAELRGCHILDDLRRRDFTINAIATTLEGHLLDPTGGQRDLAAQCIRATDPTAFQQDPVRLIRAVRQATQLQFTLDPQTSQQIRRDAAAISDTAAERVRAELVKLLRLPQAGQGLQLLHELDLLSHVLPEYHTGSAGSNRCTSVENGSLARIGRLVDTVEQLVATAVCGCEPPENCPPTGVPSRAVIRTRAMLSELALQLSAYLQEPVGSEVTRRDLLKWCALFLETEVTDQDLATPIALTSARRTASARTSERAMTRLRFSRAAVEFVAGAVGACWRFDRLIGTVPSRRQIYGFFRETRQMGPAAIIVSLAHAALHQPGSENDPDWCARLDLARVLLDAYLRQRADLVEPQPLLSGKDLMALGLDAGPKMGALIEKLREAQAAGEVSTRTEAFAWATRMIAAR